MIPWMFDKLVTATQAAPGSCRGTGPPERGGGSVYVRGTESEASPPPPQIAVCSSLRAKGGAGGRGQGLGQWELSGEEAGVRSEDASL